MLTGASVLLWTTRWAGSSTAICDRFDLILAVYFVTVRKETARVPFRSHDRYMRHKKRKKESGDETRARVKMEMGKPRMARSARIAELKLNPTRIPEPPSTSMPGTVDKIIPSSRPSKPERAQLAVDRADPRHRHLRIENALVDEHGDDVKLKKGAHAEVSVTAEPGASR
jgi:hypothetical protein